MVPRVKTLGLWAVVGFLVFWLALQTHGDVLGATVLGVHDGDTLACWQAGRKIKVRLCNIDAPELDQSGGVESRNTLRKLAPVGTKVFLYTVQRDRYGRILAEVYGPDGTDLNREQVQRGQAWVYRKYCESPGAWVPLETSARAQRIGIWRQSKPIPPWKFRHRRK